MRAMKYSEPMLGDRRAMHINTGQGKATGYKKRERYELESAVYIIGKI